MSWRLMLAAAAAAAVAFFAAAIDADAAARQYLVVLRQGADSTALAREHARTAGAEVSHLYHYALSGYAASLSGPALAHVLKDNRVAFVVPDKPAALDGQTLPLSVDRIDGELSSAGSGDGRGEVPINVAVVDTGIDVDHPDLNVVGGRNCGSDQRMSFDDRKGHGTHVAGTIGAKDNDEGVVGVVPGARLWAVRVLSGLGYGSTATALCGVDFVTSTRRDFDPTNDIAVANMSLGFKGGDDGNCGLTDHDALHLAFCNSVAAGVVWVVSAGNAATDLQTQTPAAYDEVLTATAMFDFDGLPGGLASPADSCVPPEFHHLIADDTATDFSNFATLPSDQRHTASAPGLCVYSTAAPRSQLFRGQSYGILTGTSMASPHIAGTAALCIASGPCAGLTPAEVIEKLIGDLATYTAAYPGYGFNGDPLRPFAGKYYGYLIRAALY